ncbi:hypothetical protein AN0781.2 [Aspergillus nidulans FGSC A4]|uniref:DUF8004 domain-containing protein n=1 Tax=Emericella nidulans (strain FGSC A4 / ATCC 38163 / CBS 112.46 / NRRL 194 / M139) TaxID=227321 RepID=Q5BF99_EMENI|nr:hypothetical protein [Aspergillus nidulans FGSC A4]EAA65423.1 hypothetical protein AN0781.2 [Aspergillus nidulans FGSC A4]CBF88796.1 TPA: conserved hypothetical protein [Aspergillus nidulans FGSC A4]|eukprot:XP_658385.1 hypothetical protein AN0781.2 [Aspergillus nidulans FGSC A4]
MLSAPVKSAKRISSLFSLGSHKDASSPTSPRSPSLSRPSPDQSSHDTRPRSSSRPARLSSAPAVPNFSHPGHGASPSPMKDNFEDLDAPLPPPPSLYAVNSDLAESTSNSPDGRPQSRGRRLSSSRPGSSGGLAVPSGPDSRPGTPSKRRSWMPGRARASSIDVRSSPQLPSAWIAGLEHKILYDMGPLGRGEQIPELWNETGDTYVYLFPQNTGRPPSFKIHSTVFADSASLNFLARGSDPRATGSLERQARSLSLNPNSTPTSPLTPHNWNDNDNDSAGSRRMSFEDDTQEEPQELHLYLPIPLNSDVSSEGAAISQEDLETLLLFRNLFAFLLGQSLIATPRSSSLFTIFMDIATLLARFEFTNLDGSNFGEIATSSFSNYCDELALADVRKSREKTIEAIVLGERLRFYPLYLEGFVHGVGKLDELKQLRSPKYGLISAITQKRLERGFIDLDGRLKVLQSKLNDFEFPSIFSGSANSQTTAESKVVRYKAWKAAFLEFRRFLLQYYRQKYGSWPPKPSRKNHFEESGLNRKVAKEVFEDMCNVYDMLVDRTALTDRTLDVTPVADESASPAELQNRALRIVLSEYDRSTPPVQPPIPFDIPQYPSLQPLLRKPLDPKKEAKQMTKKLKDSDVNAVLMASYTRESLKPTPFVEAFMQFERRQGHGKSLNDLIDLRCGQWILIYCIIQALPLVVVDVQDVRYTDDTEYFLCIAPRGGAPWVNSDGKVARSWFGVAGGNGLVSLPSDVVVNGVEGVYRRSHCWQMAEQWAEKDAILGPPTVDDPYDNESSISSPYPAHQSSTGSSSEHPAHLQQPMPGQQMPPTPLLTPGGGLAPPPAIPRMNSPALRARAEHRHSINPGLEALPLPAGVAPIDPPARPVSKFNPNMSFDDILKQVPNQKGKK